MVGIVLVTHGNIAKEMLAAARAIVGDVEAFEAVSTDEGAQDPDVRGRIRAAIEAADRGAGDLLVTDMFVGTPANVSLSFLSEKKIEVVTGANLPMVLKLATGRGDRSMGELAAFICEYGKKNISVASALLQEPR